MAKSLNRVCLLGNLGGDPEMKTTPQGKSVCTLNIATNDTFKDKNGEWKEITDWHKVILWEGLADTAHKYLRKGRKVYIEGRLKTRSYDDKDGVKRYITEVTASIMIMLDGGRDQGESSSYAKANEYQGSDTSYDSQMESHLPPEEDDLPF
jgi:single-strand DNA-binding protein